MPKKPPTYPGYPHLPGGGPGPGTGKPGPKTPSTPAVALTAPTLTGGGGAGGGGGQAGANPDSNPELLTRGTGPLPEWVMRDFTNGMHCNPTRDCIHEQDLWWLENLQPLASGNLVTVTNANQTGSGNSETTLPIYSALVFYNNSASVFSSYANGDGWLQNIQSGISTQIFTGTLGTTAGSVAACSYFGGPNQGFLVVSTTGFWDYNVTTAATLTSLSGSAGAWTKSFANSVAGNTQLKQVITGPGTGGLFQAHYQVIAATISAGGTGYVPGDSISLTGNGWITAATVIVTAITGGGVISGINVTAGGDFPGPSSGALVNVGPNANSGGSGTGATFTTSIQAFKVVTINPGHGYTTSSVLNDEIGAGTIIDQWFAATGPTTGTSIATYAGRVWVGQQNSLSYTDINSYNSFGGAGGNSTLSDEYFAPAGVTALYSANNYLYIFGNACVDILSNVQVNATTGLTTFTRVNALQGLGVSAYCTMSIVGYGRGVGFMDTTGYYMLAGATPERVSDQWQAPVRTISQTSYVSAGIFNLNAELCLGVLATITDTFSQVGPVNRTLMFVYQRRRWWVYSPNWFYAPSPTSYGPMVSAPTAGLYGLSGQTAFIWGLQSNNSLLVAFAGGVTSAWVMRTKWWDGAAAFREKQAINVSMGGVWNSAFRTVSFTLDTENGSSTVQALPVPPNPGSGYYLAVFRGLEGTTSGFTFPTIYGSQFIGVTFTCPGGPPTNLFTVESIALRGKQERNILA